MECGNSPKMIGRHQHVLCLAYQYHTVYLLAGWCHWQSSFQQHACDLPCLLAVCSVYFFLDVLGNCSPCDGQQSTCGEISARCSELWTDIQPGLVRWSFTLIVRSLLHRQSFSVIIRSLLHRQNVILRLRELWCLECHACFYACYYNRRY